MQLQGDHTVKTIQKHHWMIPLPIRIGCHHVMRWSQILRHLRMDMVRRKICSVKWEIFSVSLCDVVMYV